MSRRSLLSALLAGAALFAVAGGVRYLRYGGAAGLTGFGCIPGQVCFARLNSRTLPPNAVVYESGGYDGQFFHYIAAAVYSGDKVHVDAPPLRWSRIGFPVLAGWGYLLSARGLTVSMLLVLLGLHLLAIFELHGFLRERLRSDKNIALCVFLFALNPFSLLAFQLQAADGAALSLGLIGILYYLRAHATPRPRTFAMAFVGLSLAYLCKETMLAVPAGFGGGALLRFLVSPGARRREAWRMAFWVCTGIPLLIWWWAIDFTPARAAGHGGAPFLGLWQYLQAPDALYSPRSFLLILLPVFLGLGCALVYRGLTKPERNRPSFALEAGGMLLAVIALISLATNHEYWMNFANIGRMFTAGMLAWVILPVLVPNSPARRYGLYFTLGLCVWFSFLLLQREATGKLLPFFIL